MKFTNRSMTGQDEDVVRAWFEFDPMGENVVRSGEKTRKVGRIRGIASTEATDEDGDVALQDGLEWDFFLSRGYITYEHPLGALNIVGEPVSVERIEVDGVPATEVVADLYLDDKFGAELYKKSVTLKKSSNSRRLGFSIEGRGRRKGNVLERVKVHSLAISPLPKNPLAWWEPVAASLMAAIRDGMPAEEVVEVIRRSGNAEAVGYPAQGDAAEGSGGVEKIVPQSLGGGIADSQFLSGLTEDDLMVAQILRRVPQLSWEQGISALESIKSAMGGVKA